MNKGLFITFEGGEGAGKSSAMQKLAALLTESGAAVISTREPGGIPIAERIREVIIDVRHTAMDSRTEALLYAAARRQHLAEKVLPALERGNIVLCDRFVDSSLAYQGYARGLGIDEIYSINRFAIDTLMPELTLWLDVSPATGMHRIQSNAGREVNRLDLEAISFHEKVREGYGILQRKFPERIVRINAEASADQVFEQLLSVLRTRLGGRLPL